MLLGEKQQINLIRLSKSCLSNLEKKAVLGVLDRGYLGMGEEVQKFENELSKYFGRPTVCVVNGTAALHLALQACGLGPGDEVILQSLTYVASYQAISAIGAKPVSCDISPQTCLLDLEKAKKLITQNTKAIMPVHYTGGVGDLDAVYSFANKHKLRVIEDAAHAFGTVYKNKRIGSFGDIACFSFDGIKNITSGEGGCIVTENKDVLRKVKDARLLGVEKDTDKRYKRKRSWEFNVSFQGWRYHMSNIMASIGIEQLKRFPEFAKKRQQLAKYYDSILKDQKRIGSIDRNYETVVPHIYVIRIYNLKNRKYIQEQLAKKNIQVGFHYEPNHNLNMFMDKKQKKLEVTEAIASELLTLPLHPELTKKECDYVVKELVNLISVHGK